MTGMKRFFSTTMLMLIIALAGIAMPVFASEEDAVVTPEAAFSEETEDTEEALQEDIDRPEGPNDTACASYFFKMQYSQTEARKFTQLINAFRTGTEAWYYDKSDNKVYLNSLKELKYDYDLEKGAMQRAAEAAIMFDHTRPNGNKWSTEYSGSGILGENLAAGSTTAKDAMEQWKETDKKYSGQGHRRNMLGENYTCFAVGHVIFQGKHYWSMVLSSANGNLTETIAWDDEHEVCVEISDGFISNAAVDPELKNHSQIKIDIGEKANVPGFGGSFNVKERWPNASAKVSYVPADWELEDPELADIEAGVISGKSMGKCMLNASVKFAGKAYSYEYELLVGNLVGEDLSKAKTAKIPAQVFDENIDLNDFNNLKNSKGKPIDLKVKLGKEKLQPGVDYNVTVKGGDKVGTATVILTSTGTKSYGSKSIDFKIKARSLKKYVKAESIPAFVYNASAITPPIKLTDKKNGMELIEGKHFKLEYLNNIKAGKAKIIITGLEEAGYSGSIKKSFKINRCPVEEATVEYKHEVAYVKGGAVPDVTVKLNGITLEKGVDYTVKCKNNKKPGAEATFVIKGKGSYCGKTIAYTFTVM